METRIRYIDIIKGIGIVLMIAEHWFYTDAPVFSALVCSFHMPLFFIASGMLFHETSQEQLLIKRVKGLIVPILIFYCIDFVLQIILTIPQVKILETVSYWVRFRGAWFVIALFIASLLFNLIYKAVKGKCIWLFLLMALIYILGLLAAFFEVPVEDNLKKAFVGIGFYFFGFLLSRVRLAERIQNFHIVFKVAVLALSVSVLVVAAIWRNDYMVLMYNNDYGNPAVFTLKAVLCSLAVITVCILIGHCKLFEQLGKNSLLMMFLSFPVYLTLKSVFTHLFLYIWGESIFDGVVGLAINLSMITIVVLLSFFLAVLVEKKWPVLAGKRAKNEAKGSGGDRQQH